MIECEKYFPKPNSKDCRYYMKASDKVGLCKLNRYFLCIEYVKKFGHKLEEKLNGKRR